MNHQVVKSLTAKYELLRSAVCSSDFVYVTGLPSSGKTSLTRWVLEEREDYRFAFIDCNFISHTSSLFNSITEELEIPTTGSNNGLEFISSFQQFYRKAQKEGACKFYVVLDQAELLRGTDAINGLVFLSHVDNINLILVSSESPFDFLELMVKRDSARDRMFDKMALVTLTPWNEQDLRSFVLKQQPTESRETYKKFVHYVVSAIHMKNTRDPIELRSFCHEKFPSFLWNCKLRLFEHLEKSGYVKSHEDLHEIDLDDYQFSVSPNLLLSSFLGSFGESITKFEICDIGDSHINRKVTFHKICLILAAYVAAYTRPSDDKKNFVKFQKRLSKRVKQDSEDSIDHKPFTMERLIHIYMGLVELHSGEGPSNGRIPDSVLGDIQLLEDLDLIKVVSGDGLDPSTRYRLSDFVTRKYVDELGGSIGLKINMLSGLNYN